ILQKLRKEMSKTSQKFMNSFKSYKRNKMGCYILQKLRKEMSKTSQKFMNSFKSYKRNKMGCYKVGFL
ncbi:hypothetical protein KBI84_08760, partial [Campylobacter coli]|uniref:hypothetical protein n=1 Tax=Campylobacter coli TaxID=195 RepID=UPI001D0E32A7